MIFEETLNNMKMVIIQENLDFQAKIFYHDEVKNIATVMVD